MPHSTVGARGAGPREPRRERQLAISKITTDWNTFFSSATPASKRVKLVQNGSLFASSIKVFASSPLAAAVTSVDSVTLSSVTEARSSATSRR